jgi:hypothetical protein
MHATNTRQIVDPRAGLAAVAAAVIFAAGIALGSAIDLDGPAAGDPTLSVPVGDRSYDALEDTRADRGLSIPVGDHSYDALEDTRADRGLSVPAGDHSYDALEDTRADRGLD